MTRDERDNDDADRVLVFIVTLVLASIGIAKLIGWWP